MKMILINEVTKKWTFNSDKKYNLWIKAADSLYL